MSGLRRLRSKHKARKNRRAERDHHIERNTNMQNITADHPEVKDAIEKLDALREMTERTGVKSYRTANELLASLSPEVMIAVAVELKSRKELITRGNSNR